ncbi:YopX family protein [Campylobacter coli]
MKLQDFDFRIWDNIEKKYIKTPHGLYIENTEHNDASSYSRIIGNYEQRAFYIDYPFNDRNNEYYDNEESLLIELFTGFYDKNGKKIYEGDILENEELEELYLITRNDIVYNIIEIAIYRKNIKGQLYKYAKNADISFFKSIPSNKYMEIVGNINENKDLLKV